MSEKKNIDRLFQERFRDFEADPPETSWDFIYEKLHPEKKRRVIPIWWQRIGGVAAALLLGFLILDQTNVFTSGTSDTRITDAPSKKKEQNDPSRPVSDANDNEIIHSGSGENAVAGSDTGKADSPVSGDGSRAVVSSDGFSTDGQPVSTDASEKNRLKNSGTVSSDASASENTVSKTAVAASESAKEKSRIGTKSRKTGKHLIQNQNETRIAASTSASERNKRKNQGQKPSQDATLAHNQHPENDPSGKTSKNAPDTFLDTNGKNNAQTQNPVAASQPNENTRATNATALTQNGTAEQQLASTTKKDSTAIATAEPNILGELLNEKENKAVAKNEQKINRWQVQTHVAPIYLSSSGSDSPIDPQFANNGKEYRTTLSYGVGAQYGLTKRLSVRAGVNALSTEFRTNDIAFSQSASARQLRHLDSNMPGSMMSIQATNAPIELSSFNINESSGRLEGSISQKTGYIEVPVELSYQLLQKRFGVEVIGGFSTLFLRENEISIISGSSEMNIGQANNLNDTHFSTNLGLGLSYRILKGFQFRCEPMLKYQLNAYNDAGNFRPYFFGLYTGFNYRF